MLVGREGIIPIQGLVCAVVVTYGACGCRETVTKKELVGTWVYEVDRASLGEDEVRPIRIVVRFEENGTMELILTHGDREGRSATYPATGTYSVEGEVVRSDIFKKRDALTVKKKNGGLRISFPDGTTYDFVKGE